MTQPVYLRIADTLRRQIASRQLAPGDRVPSRHELAREYGVSDRVAVEAVRLLVSEGLLETRPGSGTYVRERPRLRRLTRSWYRDARQGSPFAADMQVQGHLGQWDSESETASAPSHVAECLGIAEDDPVMRTKYVFKADDEPVMLSTSWEPLTLTGGTDVMFPESGPHAGAGVIGRMRVIGVEIVAATEIVSARPSTAAEGELLGVAPGTLVITIRRTYGSAEHGLVETADIVVPVDRYELAYVIPVGGD